MIAILEGQEFIAGGVLITRDKIVTSATTVIRKITGEIIVKTGDWNKTSTMEDYPHQDRLVKVIILHEEY